MSRQKSVIDPTLVPGHARLVLQLYRRRTRSYTQPPGFSMSGIRVRDCGEVERLWAQLTRLADDRSWTEVD